MQATFPHLCSWQDVRFWPVGMSLDPQESISGVSTIVPTMRARWMAQIGLVIHGEAATLEWQAFLAQMEGRIGTTLVPALSRFRPTDRNGRRLSFCAVSELGDAQTWEHFGFQKTQITRAAVATAAPLRASQIDLRLFNTTGLRPGQFFSIGPRLHQVKAHWQPDSITHRITFRPPLRGPVAAGAPVEIERPVCQMRMVSETEGLFDQALEVMPAVQVKFEEAL